MWLIFFRRENIFLFCRTVWYFAITFTCLPPQHTIHKIKISSDLNKKFNVGKTCTINSHFLAYMKFVQENFDWILFIVHWSLVNFSIHSSTDSQNDAKFVQNGYTNICPKNHFLHCSIKILLTTTQIATRTLSDKNAVTLQPEVINYLNIFKIIHLSCNLFDKIQWKVRTIKDSNGKKEMGVSIACNFKIPTPVFAPKLYNTRLFWQTFMFTNYLFYKWHKLLKSVWKCSDYYLKLSYPFLILLVTNITVINEHNRN